MKVLFFNFLNPYFRYVSEYSKAGRKRGDVQFLAGTRAWRDNRFLIQPKFEGIFRVSTYS